jgi:hypothetical protein
MPNLIRNDYAFGAITKALDGLSLRSKAITNNVANIDTPGFKSAEVTFEQELQAAVLPRLLMTSRWPSLMARTCLVGPLGRTSDWFRRSPRFRTA